MYIYSDTEWARRSIGLMGDLSKENVIGGNKKMKAKQIGALVLGGLVIASGAGIAGHYISPAEKIVEKEVLVEVPVEVPVEVLVEVPVEVEKIVEVDNGKLALVLDHIYDNNGNVEYLLGDLDDDEVSEIANRIVFVNDIKSIAEQKVKEKFADEIDNRKFTIVGLEEDVEFDEDDISKIKIDSDEVEIEGDIDFEDGDAVVSMLVKFEGDDKIEYEAIVKVEFDDGDFDEINIESVKLRG